jgi:hypothetical protein
VKAAELLDSAQVNDLFGTRDVKQVVGDGKIEVSGAVAGDVSDPYVHPERLQAQRRKADDTSGDFLEAPFPLAGPAHGALGQRQAGRASETSQ